MSPLISAADLRAVRDAVSVLDVRYRMGGPPGSLEHAAGHVPGAAYVDLDRDLASPPGVGGRHPLPDPAAFAAAMRRCGVRRDRPVVVYDDWSGHAASRCWWLLRHHGHDDVRVLDGGWAAWRAAGGELATGPVTPTPGDFVATRGRLPVVGADEVLTVGVLIDARAPERYRGDTEPVDPVAGHVPGAVNAPTVGNLDAQGRFRSPGALRERYAALGVTSKDGADGVDGADAAVAVYCGSGVTACHDLLALEVAGLTGAALYPGSWSEWVGDTSRPVQTG